LCPHKKLKRVGFKYKTSLSGSSLVGVLIVKMANKVSCLNRGLTIGMKSAAEGTSYSLQLLGVTGN
jgi:hypothetical protein